MTFPPADFCRCLVRHCERKASCLRANMANTGPETPYMMPAPSLIGYNCTLYVSDGSEIEEDEP